MNASNWILATLIAMLASGFGGYNLGRGNGVAAQQARQDHQAVADLAGLLDSHANLIKQADAASLAMRQAAARREAADRQTTKELRHALDSTAGARAGCLFDSGVLRQLAAARDRAAQAAAGGVRGALPAASASAGKP
ncbi:MAG: hypothetical protein FWG56_01690 [Desulfovibrionaceae bacterium]|jgi:hypothetical protein|nr:hypothetical protein [Desulfovibrionaceae bacterium]